MAFYTLKDFVHNMGLDMGEFKRLDAETQEKWRASHQRKLKEKLAERDAAYDEYLFRHEFLPKKHVNPDTFDELADWKKEEWQKQFKEWKRWKARSESTPCKSEDELANQSAIDVLIECGVPFGPDGPLGI